MTLPKPIRDNLATVIAAVLVVAVLLASFLLFRPRVAKGVLVARIHDADGKTYELPLDKDDELSVTTALGTNVIAVADGEVRMLQADCPHGDCLHQHALSSPGQQIICLPHQLWIEVTEAGAPDGELDVTAVSDEDGIDLVSR